MCGRVEYIISRHFVERMDWSFSLIFKFQPRNNLEIKGEGKCNAKQLVPDQNIAWFSPRQCQKGQECLAA